MMHICSSESWPEEGADRIFDQIFLLAGKYTKVGHNIRSHWWQECGTTTGPALFPVTENEPFPGQTTRTFAGANTTDNSNHQLNWLISSFYFYLVL